MLDMVLAEANDVVEFLDHLLPFLLLFVLGKLLLDLSFSLQRFCKITFCSWRFRADCLPLTCCSSVIITSTAILRMPSFVCGLSDLRCDMHIRPSSLRASLISRILILRNMKFNWKFIHKKIDKPLSSVIRLSPLFFFTIFFTRIQILIIVIVVVSTRTTTGCFATLLDYGWFKKLKKHLKKKQKTGQVYFCN